MQESFMRKERMMAKTKADKINKLKAEAYDLLQEEGRLIEATKKAMVESGTRRQQINEEIKALESKPKE